MDEKIKKLIEDAKSNCKSQYGEGHYSQSAFWHFIVEIERELKGDR